MTRRQGSITSSAQKTINRCCSSRTSRSENFKWHHMKRLICKTIISAKNVNMVKNINSINSLLKSQYHTIFIFLIILILFLHHFIIKIFIVNLMFILICVRKWQMMDFFQIIVFLIILLIFIHILTFITRHIIVIFIKVFLATRLNFKL
ncbi:hypothetical protein V8G54_036777 [Vigna mungo]|uniref:Uncharacterized protein n=1 Tax=Vigna mungo TaxID=3915 RepID=A0AAQ3RD97_VIGMU